MCFFLFLPILHMPPLLPKKGQGGDQNPRVRRNDCTLMCTDGHHCRKQNACYPIPSCWNAGITVPLAPCPNGHFVMVPILMMIWPTLVHCCSKLPSEYCPQR